ncbi:hypothetical protein N9937_01815 [bacterium]|nr:hypothetical protein [bacterium]
MANVITLPHEYNPREYQKPIWKALFEEKKKRLLCLWHRRAGKDKTCVNIIVAAAHETIGSYYYLFPELKQARRVIWEGIGKDGKRFIDHFPKDLIKRVNNIEMVIEFNNGSIFRICGADRYDALMGSNPVGIIFSEYSLQNPRAWDYMRPILAENDGWALFQYTPRGTNHGFTLYDEVKDNPKWFVQKLTCKDTFKPDGSPVITEEMIQDEISAGMSEDMVQQEFYCSFTAAVRGAYFGKGLSKCEDQGRIKDFLIDPTHTVSTYWDLGWNDATSIWFIQNRGNDFHAISYYENNMEDLQHYINYLHDFRSKYGIVYDKHYSPHDGSHKRLGSGESIIDKARKLGILFERVPRIAQKIDAIERARSILPRMVFHKTNCAYGLSCLREYHSEYKERYGVFSDKPVHNWASHGSDSFMTFAQSWHETNQRNHQSRRMHSRVNQNPVI